MKNVCDEYIFDRVEEILNSDEIFILGEGDYADLAIEMLSDCIKEKQYSDKSPAIRRCGQETESTEEGFCTVDELLKRDNSSSGLILCQNYEKSDRLTINLMKSGFKNIVKGIEMVNSWYKEVAFFVEDAETDAVSEDEEEDSDIAELRKSLKDNKSTVGYLRLAEYYEGKKNYLLAYDYCLRGEKISGDSTLKAKKEKLEIILEKEEISLGDYAEALDKYVDLPYFGRSGSIYFQSLLEGHSQIITIPPGIIYFPYYRIYSLFIAKKGSVKIGEIVDAFEIDDSIQEDYYEAVNIRTADGKNIYPEAFKEKYLSFLEKIIKDKAKHTCIIKEKFLIQAMFLAHSLALGRIVDIKKGIPYIANHMHTSDLALDAKVLNLFGDATVICTTRSLVQNFGSNVALYLRMFDKEMAKLKIMDLFFYYYNHPIFKQIGINHKIYWARLESMNEKPEELLRKIAELLDIDWEDSLLESTINGTKMYDSYAAKGSYGNGPRTSGIAKTYEEYLDSFDRYRLEALYSPFLEMCSYPCTDYVDAELLKNTADVPFRFERILSFKDEVERKKYRDRIRRFIINTADRKEEVDRGAKGYMVL